MLAQNEKMGMRVEEHYVYVTYFDRIGNNTVTKLKNGKRRERERAK